LDVGEHVTPDARVECYLLEGRKVAKGKRFEADSGAFEGWGGHRIILRDGRV
jgi:hypothetical protein